MVRYRMPVEWQVREDAILNPSAKRASVNGVIGYTPKENAGRWAWFPIHESLLKLTAWQYSGREGQEQAILRSVDCRHFRDA
jgi:hypothetical protein